MEAVVLTAERLSVADSAGSSTDNGDGGAVETNERVDILNDDAEDSELLSDGGTISSTRRVAALDGGSVALRSWRG